MRATVLDVEGELKRVIQGKKTKHTVAYLLHHATARHPQIQKKIDKALGIKRHCGGRVCFFPGGISVRP
jgi:hypothetical protein